ncbi:MAG: glycosyltransferase [Verrucomicrobiaceae bacterium]|nr:MAG: glycosyltransferase [Verrucomicrobiaceae bacterium]
MEELRPLVSIVTPLFNEAENLDALGSRLGAVFEANKDVSWEWVAVDDGSSDGTALRLKDALVRAPRWQMIRFSRNFGQQAALRAGLASASGDAVIFLDADLQDPPEVIPELVVKWKAGAQVVFAARRSRGETFPRRLLITLFHSGFQILAGRIMPQDSGNFGLCDREVADILRKLPEHDAFLPALRAWTGFETATVEYDRAARLSGKGLSFSRLVGFAWNAVTAFSDAPLRLIFLSGLVISALSFTYGSVLLAQRILQFFGFFKDLEVLGFTTVAVAVFFMGGVQLLSIGIIGEYLARVYREVKGRPHFIVSKREAGDQRIP